MGIKDWWSYGVRANRLAPKAEELPTAEGPMETGGEATGRVDRSLLADQQHRFRAVDMPDTVHPATHSLGPLRDAVFGLMELEAAGCPWAHSAREVCTEALMRQVIKG